MSVPKIRASQLVTTFGPGSMVDFPEDSVLISGLDAWKFGGREIESVIDEPRLAAKLSALLAGQQVLLRRPPHAPDNEIQGAVGAPAYAFPEWVIVQFSERTAEGHRARRLVHRKKLSDGRYRDHDHRKHRVVPVRFVRACPHGHIDDVDWKQFVHEGPADCIRDLWLEERGTSGSLEEVWVRCGCGKKRKLSDAAQAHALGTCDGSRPWLGPYNQEECKEPNRLLIRSASNAYFAQLLSAISIPDHRKAIELIVTELWEDFLCDVGDLAALQAMIAKKPSPRRRLEGLDEGQVMAAINRRHAGLGNDDQPNIKLVELEAFTQAKPEIGADVPDGDFYARELEPKLWQAAAPGLLTRVVLVHRLREVIAQVGFTRFEAAGPDIHGELALDIQRAPLARDADWLPAVENRGEGIFLEFSGQAIEKWQFRDDVIERAKTLLAGFNAWKADHPKSKRDFPGLPYYMLHSLSHLLLTSIALECGYPASALRERVYAEAGSYGVLIYTGSSDSEGTLGGLVEAGRSIRRHLQRALELGTLCSNDPICAQHQPNDHSGQWLTGSACHGCLLIAETSCEQHNEFLDRALVVPTIHGRDTAFFKDLA